jgi:hypothetical protein
MRAREFITEAINPEVFKPGFNKTQNMGAYTLKAYVDPKQQAAGPSLRIDAIGNQTGQLIGSAVFQPKDLAGKTISNLNQLGKDGSLESLLTDIRPDQRNKGVGSAMYNFVRRMGNQLNPSSLGQTPAGKSFWDKGAGVNKIGQQGPTVPGTTAAGAQPTTAAQTTQPVQPAATTAKAPAWQQNARYMRDANGNLVPNPQANVKAPVATTAPAKPVTRATPTNIKQQVQNIQSQPTDWNRSSRDAGYAGGYSTTPQAIAQPQINARPQTNMVRSNLMTPVASDNPAIAASNARGAAGAAASNARLAQTVAADQARFGQTGNKAVTKTTVPQPNTTTQPIQLPNTSGEKAFGQIANQLGGTNPNTMANAPVSKTNVANPNSNLSTTGGGGAITKGVAGTTKAPQLRTIGKGADEYTNFYPAGGTPFQNQQYVKDLQTQLTKNPNDPNLKGELAKMQKQQAPASGQTPERNIPMPRNIEPEIDSSIFPSIPAIPNSNDLIERKRK